ncbi:hypothetical protein ACTA71_011314 [Dictyostelium dimigraforme]
MLNGTGAAITLFSNLQIIGSTKQELFFGKPHRITQVHESRHLPPFIMVVAIDGQSSNESSRSSGNDIMVTTIWQQYKNCKTYDIIRPPLRSIIVNQPFEILQHGLCCPIVINKQRKPLYLCVY